MDLIYFFGINTSILLVILILLVFLSLRNGKIRSKKDRASEDVKNIKAQVNAPEE